MCAYLREKNKNKKETIVMLIRIMKPTTSFMIFFLITSPPKIFSSLSLHAGENCATYSSNNHANQPIPKLTCIIHSHNRVIIAVSV